MDQKIDERNGSFALFLRVIFIIRPVHEWLQSMFDFLEFVFPAVFEDLFFFIVVIWIFLVTELSLSFVTDVMLFSVILVDDYFCWCLWRLNLLWIRTILILFLKMMNFTKFMGQFGIREGQFIINNLITILSTYTIFPHIIHDWAPKPLKIHNYILSFRSTKLKTIHLRHIILMGDRALANLHIW